MTAEPPHGLRDADLIERLNRYDRGERTGLPGMRSVALSMLQEEQAARDAEAARLASMPRETRRRAVIRAVFENSPPNPTDVRHIHSVLAVCGLPYDSLPIDVRRFERTQGQMSLVAHAGELQTPDGKWEPQPLPFGPKARLLMMHLCSEAVRQKSATIEIADSLTGFVRDMGFPDSGGKKGPMTAFKRQINALAACTLKVGVWDGTTAKTRTIVPFESIDVWLPTNPAQRTLWPSTITFSDTMFRSLERHALPVNVRAVQAFAGSARKLDLYFWLGWRLHNIDGPIHMSWAALGAQFGQGFGRARDFQRQLAEELGHIKEVFPKLPLRVTERGVILEPADPAVLALPAPKPARKVSK